jgi:hypothetical protein
MRTCAITANAMGIVACPRRNLAVNVTHKTLVAITAGTIVIGRQTR